MNTLNGSLVTIGDEGEGVDVFFIYSHGHLDPHSHPLGNFCHEFFLRNNETR